jgi:hypothetical protein
MLKAQQEIRELKASKTRMEGSLNGVEKKLGAKELVLMIGFHMYVYASHGLVL